MNKYINKILVVLTDQSKVVYYYRDPKNAWIKAQRLHDLKDSGDSDIKTITESKIAYRGQKTED